MGTLNARFQHKRDTSQNWTKADPVLLEGEIIIVDTQNGEKRTKTGDGKKKYTELPFDDEAVRNLVNSKGNPSASLSGTLHADNWSGSQQSVSLSGLTVDSNGIASVASSASAEAYDAAKAADIRVLEQSENSLTFVTYGEVPTVDIPISVVVFEGV